MAKDVSFESDGPKMFAIIKTGGKQYRVKQNDVIQIEKVAGEAGTEIFFDEVLLACNAETTEIGNPNLEGATVIGTIIEQTRSRKILVFKKKRRKNYRRLAGHRQEITSIQINEIKASLGTAKKIDKRNIESNAEAQPPDTTEPKATKQKKPKAAIKSEATVAQKSVSKKDAKAKDANEKKPAKTAKKTASLEKPAKRTKQSASVKKSSRATSTPSKTEKKEIE